MEARHAARIAKNFFTRLFDRDTMENLTLEEIERTGDYWDITFGFIRVWGDGAPGESTGSGARRDYRIVRLRDDDGEIVSVKMHAFRME